ncbi:hypothetical protein NDU88_004816 [Pleurodeles waltl]|uniref:Uncharacterized protein n=1 Tax=Pleurodeles waltl TaxID=8319 RepID=A0AAV7V432_PLEWA|nr:hypothetical protein NDU88_004816 [Pleurodeles waltl]
MNTLAYSKWLQPECRTVGHLFDVEGMIPFDTLKYEHALPEPSVITRYKDPEIPRYRDPEIPRYRDPEIARYRDPEIPKYRDPEIPRYRDPEIPRYMDPDIPRCKKVKFQGPESDVKKTKEKEFLITLKPEEEMKKYKGK